jgi:hypothetical protein
MRSTLPPGKAPGRRFQQALEECTCCIVLAICFCLEFVRDKWGFEISASRVVVAVSSIFMFPRLCGSRSVPTL